MTFKGRRPTEPSGFDRAAARDRAMSVAIRYGQQFSEQSVVPVLARDLLAALDELEAVRLAILGYLENHTTSLHVQAPSYWPPYVCPCRHCELARAALGISEPANQSASREQNPQ